MWALLWGASLSCSVCQQLDPKLTHLDLDPQLLETAAKKHKILLVLVYSPFCARSKRAITHLEAAAKWAANAKLPNASLLLGKIDILQHQQTASSLLGEPIDLVDAALPAYRLVRGDPSYGAIYRGGYESNHVVEYIKQEIAILSHELLPSLTMTRVVARLDAKRALLFRQVAESFRGIVHFEISEFNDMDSSSATGNFSARLVRESTEVMKDEVPEMHAPEYVLMDPGVKASDVERWVRWAAVPTVHELTKWTAPVYLRDGPSAIIFPPTRGFARKTVSLLREVANLLGNTGGGAPGVPPIWLLHVVQRGEHVALRKELGFGVVSGNDVSSHEIVFVWMVGGRIGASFVAKIDVNVTAHEVVSFARGFLHGEYRDSMRVRVVRRFKFWLLQHPWVLRLFLCFCILCGWYTCRVGFSKKGAIDLKKAV